MEGLTAWRVNQETDPQSLREAAHSLHAERWTATVDFREFCLLPLFLDARPGPGYGRENHKVICQHD
jgi:hypothetical protein